jgi:hypothetical protein
VFPYIIIPKIMSYLKNLANNHNIQTQQIITFHKSQIALEM